MGLLASPALAQEVAPTAVAQVGTSTVGGSEDGFAEELTETEAVARDEADAAAEEIVVTGTRIARSDLTSYGNIEVIEAEQLQATGALTVDDLLRRLPAITLNGVNATRNNGGGGLRTIDLRNLGEERALVLVNGRRFIQRDSFVDINTIPVQMIERIEVLFDGASAIYGSDAVAGVINFILKDEFEGLQAEVQLGTPTEGGGGEQINVAVTGGASNAKGNMVIHGSYVGYNELGQYDRDFSRGNVTSINTDPGGNTWFGIGSSLIPNGRSIGSGPSALFTPLNDGTGLSYRPYQGTVDQTYDFAQDSFLFGAQDRWQLYGLGKYELFDSADFTSEAYAESTMTYRVTRTQLAGFPISFQFGPSSNNPTLNADWAAAALAPGQAGATIFRRATDIGDREIQNTATDFRQLVGVRGEFLERFNYDLYGQYVRGQELEQFSGNVDTLRGRIVNDPSLASRFGLPVADMTGPEVFGDVADQIGLVEDNIIEHQMVNVFAGLGAELVALPTTNKPISLATGFEYRQQDYTSRPDIIVQRGDSSGNAAGVTRGFFNVFEGYAEALLPLASDLPGIYDLGIDAAFRVSSVSRDTGESNTEPTYRIRGRYEPFAGLATRVTYSTAFRAPSAAELFSPASESFETLADPCNGLGTPAGPALDSTIGQNCVAQGVPVGYQQTGTQISSNVGGNVNLEPETSNAFNVGAVLDTQPWTFVPPEFGRFTASFDFYTYEVDNAIDAPSGAIVLSQCYASPNGSLSSPFCRNINRDPNQGSQIVGLNLTSGNIASIYTSGIDFGFGYTYDLQNVGLPQAGVLSANFDGNYLLSYEDTPFEGAETNELAGKALGGATGFAFTEIRWRLTTAWNIDKFTLAAFWSYFDSMENFNASEGDFDYIIGEITYLDMSASWVEDNWQVTLGMNNVTNESPPFATAGDSNSLVIGPYDFLGRNLFLRASYTF